MPVPNNQSQKFEGIQFVGAMGPPGGMYHILSKSFRVNRYTLAHLLFFPFSGGRNPVTPRVSPPTYGVTIQNHLPPIQFLRHFNTVTITAFDDATLQRIFESILDWHLSSNNFSKEISEMTKSIVDATRRVYRGAMSNLLPTPKKSHYTFNLRDFARVIQGVLLARPETVTEKGKMVRLWMHEAYRVFYDRLIDDDDRRWFFNFNKKEVIKSAFNMEFDKVFQMYDTNGDGVVENDDLRSLIFGTYLSQRDAAGRAYDEMPDLAALTDYMEKSLAEYNQISKKPMNLGKVVLYCSLSFVTYI